jgi:hypothetical protein
MKYKEFSKCLNLYKKGQEMISDLYDIGFDLMEGKYNFSEIIEGQLELTLKSNYDDEGLDWVMWFIWENKYGKKDWNDLKNPEEKIPLGHGAFTKKEKPIFYSMKSTWERLEKKHKLNKNGKTDNSKSSES